MTDKDEKTKVKKWDTASFISPTGVIALERITTQRKRGTTKLKFILMRWCVCECVCERERERER